MAALSAPDVTYINRAARPALDPLSTSISLAIHHVVYTAENGRSALGICTLLRGAPGACVRPGALEEDCRLTRSDTRSGRSLQTMPCTRRLDITTRRTPCECCARDIRCASASMRARHVRTVRIRMSRSLTPQIRPRSHQVLCRVQDDAGPAERRGRAQAHNSRARGKWPVTRAWRGACGA